MDRGRGLVLAGALAAMLASGGLVRAQAPSLEQQQERLAAANRASQAAKARSQRLERAADRARDQAAQARAREEAAAARIRAAEADIAAARARIAIVDRRLRAQRVRVAERQGPITRLIAALQSLARRPPVLGLVQPGSLQDMVHVRAVLGTTLPVVEARTADVRAELDRIRGLRRGAERAVASLREGRERLEAERLGLVRMEAAHRARSVQLDRSAMVESDRALALGERAREIAGSLETMGTAAQVQADLAALPGPLPRPPADGETPAAPTPSRHAAPYRMPVPGQVVTGLGELSANGVRARGVTIATWPGAEIGAPAAGRVLYAAPFRHYGTIVIIDHGKGWTSLITGFDGLAVRRGDMVRQGAPLGRAGQEDGPRVTVELRRRGRAIDLTALLGR